MNANQPLMGQGACPYPAQRPRHLVRVAAPVALKTVREDRLRS